MSSFDKSQTRKKTKRKTKATAKKMNDEDKDDDGYSERACPYSVGEG
jgi:hypothetical protein